MALTQAEILDILHKGQAEVKFTKKNGEERTMWCTLNEEFLPKVEEKSDKEPRKRPEGLISVYDLDKKAWRSFYVDSVQYIAELH